TLVTQERVHRLPRKKILFEAPQEKSLMPDGLLNRLSWEDLRDLLAFLHQVGSRPAPEDEEKPGEKK
ncbi:MAG: hypothetical protein O7J95_06305, partial [Planctomycetota bacterium]|nr:hypothetical protein [Planctomycetota bacterium]